MPRRTEYGRGSVPWWLHPMLVFAVVNGVAVLLVAAYPAQLFGIIAQEPRLWNLYATLVSIVAIVAFAAGIGLVLVMPRRAHLGPVEPVGDAPFRRLILLVLTLSAIGTAVGYIFWIGAAFRAGFGLGVALNVIRGQLGAIYRVKSFFRTMPGLTTLTQLGIVTVITHEVARSRGWVKKRHTRMMVAVIGVSIVRAILVSERLAFLELAVPLLLFRVREWWEAGVHRRRSRSLLSVAPLLFVLGVWVFFVLSEYLRSWVNVYDLTFHGSWVAFGTARLAAYYATAMNNGWGLLTRTGTVAGHDFPFFTVRWIWKFPLFNRLLLPKGVMNPDQVRLAHLLSGTLNPEYNNPGGLFTPMVDFGIVGGATYWALSGTAVYLFFLSFRRHRLVGELLYPIAFVTMLESPRFLYWASGRAFPAIAVLAAAAVIVVVFRRRVWADARARAIRRPVPPGG